MHIGLGLRIPQRRLCAPAASFEGILDTLATSAAGAWSVARRLTADYEGDLVRLRRASDNVESDFGYDGDGVLDTAAIATWIGGSSAAVVTIYDQIGAQDLTQGTAGNQPAYSATAVSGKPGASCADTGDIIKGTLSPAPSGAQAHCLYAVGSISGAVVGLCYVGDNSAGGSSCIGTFVGDDWWWGGSSRASGANLGGAFDTDPHAFVKTYDGTTAKLYVDGSEVTPNSAGATAFNFSTGGIGFNTIDGTTNGAGTPKMAEMVWFPTDVTSGDRAALATDAATFYGL